MTRAILLCKPLINELNSDRFTGEMNREKLTVQIGITFGVLRRLGFREEDVLACLRSICGIDIEEALDWVRGIYVIGMSTTD